MAYTLEGRDAASGTVLTNENPWPALLPFLERDEEFFRGREDETDELLRRIERERLTVLLGVSGLGKTSLLQAGIFPKLRRNDVLPVYIRFSFEEPLTDQVYAAVSRETEAHGVESPVRIPGDTLWEFFHRVDADFWNARNRPVLPVLVFDQFEELFTLGRAEGSHASTEAFLIELADLAEGRPPAAVRARLGETIDDEDGKTTEFLFRRHYYKIVLSIREDFLPELEELRPRMGSVVLNRMRLQPMNGEAALEAVDQAPIVDTGVAEQIVRFVAGRKASTIPLRDLEVDPAILSVVCSELNRARQEQGHAKISAGLLAIRQEEVIHEFYVRVLRDMPVEVRRFIQEELLTAKGFRNSVAYDDATSGRFRGMTEAVVATLIDRRLLRVEPRGNRIELAHDVLTGEVCKARDADRIQLAEDEARREIEQARVEQEQRDRQRRVAEDAKRSRLLSIIAAIVASLFILLAVLATWKWIESNIQKAELQRQKGELEKQRDKLDAQTKELARLKSEAENREQKAVAAADKESKAAAAALKAQSQANDERNSAFKARTDAETQKNRADQLAHDEAAARKQADEQKEVARSEAANARQARANEEKQRRAAQALLSVSMLTEAGRRVSDEKNKEALALLARALELDPVSVPAAALVADLLLHGEIPAGQPAMKWSGPPLIHAPVKLSSPVTSALFSSAGDVIAAATRDGRVTLIATGVGNTTVGKQLRSWKAHANIVNSISFSSDGKLLLTASQDQSASLWDASSGTNIWTTKHSGPVSGAAFSGDGRRVVTASWDRTAVVRDARSGDEIATLRHPEPVTSASFNADGTLIVTSSWDNAARVWSSSSQQPLYRVEHRGMVNTASFSPAGLVVTASEDGTAQVWSGTRRVGPLLRHDKAVNSAAFDTDGQRVVTASDDRTARVWQTETGLPLSVQYEHGARVNYAAFDKSGRRVVTVSDDKTIRLWEVRYEPDKKEIIKHAAEAYAEDERSLPPSVKLSADRDTLRRNLPEFLSADDPKLGGISDIVRWFLAGAPK